MNFWHYTWWWSRIGGRPWTFILRDWWIKFELLWVIALVAIGATLGECYGWPTILKILVIFVMGVLFGHLFWSTSNERWGNEIERLNREVTELRDEMRRKYG